MNNKIVFALNTGQDKEFESLKNTFVQYGFDSGLLKQVEGCWHNTIEKSYMYPWTYSSSKLIRALAAKHNQEAVLYIEPDYIADLYDVKTDKMKRSIGIIKQTTAGIAQQQEGYTRIGDCYYILEEL